MFFYLSFLRPPPIQAPLHGTISITPQISNDLRTEPFEGTQDLFYSWIMDSSLSNSIPQPHTSTKPIKLTTWRPASAYKEIPVPIPPNVREGQQWRLILTCQAQGYDYGNPESIDLRETTIGLTPFPVMSVPVAFSSKTMRGKRDGKGKQEMIERTYLLPFMIKSQDKGTERTVAFVHFLEKTSYDLDKKIWDSGIGLSSWMCELNANDTLGEGCESFEKLQSTLFLNERCKIVELGAGIGMASVALAVLRAGTSMSSSMGRDGDIILATDVDTAMPLLQQNISNNSRYFLSAPQALVLDWDDEALPPEVCDLGELDIIVMADVSYNTASFPALSRTLSRLVRLGATPPIIILGYKERDKAERTFWDMTTQIGIHFEKVGERKGAGGAPVEIWLGSYSSSTSTNQ